MHKERFASSEESAMHRVTLVLLLLLTLALPSRADLLTVGAVFGALENLIKQLEQSGQSLLQAGNAYAGQQQLTLAATIRSTVQQSREMFKDSLDATDDKLSGQRRSVMDSLRSLLKQADDARAKVGCDLRDSIFLASGQANVVLGRIPLATRPPAFFGILPQDPACPKNDPADVVLTGFYLSDPALKGYSPVVKVDGTEIPSTNISAKFDRISVVLPDELKTRLGFQGTPCQALKPYKVELKTFWTNWPSLANIISYLVKESTFSDFAKRGRQLYDVTLKLDGKNKTTSMVPGTFSVGSGSRNWDCEQDIAALVSFTAPEPGAAITGTPSTRWDLHGRWENNYPGDVLVSGATASSTGRVRGGNKVWFGPISNCPGGGNGEYFMSGTYQYPVIKQEDFSYTKSLLLDREISDGMPIGGGTTPTALHIEVRMRNCGNLLDSADLALTDATSRKEGTSNKGTFKVVYDAGQVRVEGTALLVQ